MFHIWFDTIALVLAAGAFCLLWCKVFNVFCQKWGVFSVFCHTFFKC